MHVSLSSFIWTDFAFFLITYLRYNKRSNQYIDNYIQQNDKSVLSSG